MPSAGSKDGATDAAAEVMEVDLKDPLLAAFLAWLVPGAGHFYQGRTAKGIVFLTCILGTFLCGLYLGQGRVVYASMRPEDRRWPYLGQVGAGLVALPALVQAQRLRQDKEPLMGGLMAPPRLDRGFASQDAFGRQVLHPDELAKWHYELDGYFDLGTVYTLIAGLLNILAIYDAWAGPVWITVDDTKRRRRGGKADVQQAKDQLPLGAENRV